MVVPDLDVPRCDGRAASPKNQAFPSGFQKIVDDLIRPSVVATGAARYGLRIHATPSDGHTMKVIEIGVDYCHELAAAKCYASRGFILRRAVHPYPVKHDVVGTLAGKQHQIVDSLARHSAGNLEADEAIVIRSRGEAEGAASSLLIKNNLCHHIRRRRTRVSRPSRQGCHRRIAGSDACSLSRKILIGRTGA